MQNEQKGNMLIWSLIVVAVIAILVFITVKSKNTTPDILPEQQASENNQTNQNMQTQQLKGVKVTILKEGEGDVAKSGDTIAMNYTGKLMDGTDFDSNVDPKFGHVQPFIFTLGARMVIEGWDTGIVGMKVGEKRNLVIDPEYAYGALGYPPKIPPNATLSFDVELVAIKK